MSIDLDVVTHLLPTTGHVRDALPAAGRFHLEGELAGEAGNVLVTRAAPYTDAFTVDGPHRIETEDLSEAVAAAAVAPRWLVQINIPIGASKQVRAAADRMARQLARSCQGVVFDPQLDAVTWPRGAPRTPRSKAQRITRTMRVDICLSPSRFTPELPRTMLATARRHFRHALPRRYGTFEPLQHRLDVGEEQFVGAWLAERKPFGGWLSWKGERPVEWGGVDFPDIREEARPAGAAAAGSLWFHLDGDTLLGEDARWREALVDLVLHLCSETGAFYGRALLEPPQPEDLPASRVYEFLIPGSIVERAFWFGLPREASWLTWFGEGYAGRVRGHLPARLVVERPEGLLLRMGEVPADPDALEPRFPELPEELLRQPDGWRRGRAPDNSRNWFQPAPVIPLEDSS